VCVCVHTQKIKENVVKIVTCGEYSGILKTISFCGFPIRSDVIPKLFKNKHTNRSPMFTLLLGCLKAGMFCNGIYQRDTSFQFII
jgi:hypothetical protein